ncbi:MAG: NAD-dependent epimerase/dehydratase family protein [Bacteroidetes bacterium]|nr:NAD-dependent epimerase/dehydratase family protein [Bacteroidota bacterium]
MSTPKVLIIGAGGQLGQELAPALARQFGQEQLVLSDLKPLGSVYAEELLDVTDKAALAAVVQKHRITHIYHLAALLSATGEKNPGLAWQINMQGLLNVLDVCVEAKIERLFWPSSIAVFGPTTPRHNTPQRTIIEPATIYGITKQAGEHLCDWYFRKHGLDVRSLRYPGLISWKAEPGGGTTDYAVHIFFEALRHNAYTCFLGAGSALPMMYMPDAVRATLELMAAPAEKLSIRTSYNLSALSFTPAELAATLQKLLPDFRMDYAPDFRQAIADSWPASIDDSEARKDWGWQPEWSLDAMVQDMLTNIRQKLQVA